MRIAVVENRLFFTLEDNGQGFIVDTAGPGRFGTSNIRARAAQLGADLDISSVPGEGTRMELAMDFPASDQGL